MALQAVTTKVIGLEKLHVKLGDDLPQEYRRMMFRIRGHALKQAKERARPHMVDKGTLANSIKGAARMSNMSARIWTNLTIAVEAEEGRSPGKPPSSRALQRWMKRHSLRSDWKSVKAMRTVMKTRGTKGIKFMEGAGEDTQAHVPEFIAETERRIEKAWAA